MVTPKVLKKSNKKQTKKELKKVIGSYNRKVTRDNKAFDKLKPAEKRVFIAQDVLKQLAAKKIIAAQSTWVNTRDGSSVISEKALKQDKELKDVFDSMKSCDACALGGLFVCAVKINDRLKISEMQHVKTHSTASSVYKEHEDDVSIINPDSADFRGIYLNDIEQYLCKFFSKDQLKLIELAFEGGDGGYNFDGTNDQVDAVEFFSDLTVDGEDGDYVSVSVKSEDRMRLVMQNIIANKGKFVPSKKPEVTVSFSMPGFKG